MKFVSISFSKRFAFFFKDYVYSLWVGGIVHVNSGARGEQNKGVESLDPWSWSYWLL